jgi:TolB-like protein/DNA-binding winged helix-turn-helix (wHTH) protein/Tfp pilus assembly protein PilF
MPEAHHPPGRARFGVFEVDLQAGELRKQGLRIRLQDQPFQVLAMLLGKPKEVVTREELHKRLWTADTFVDFDHGLNKAINKLRDALGDSAENPRFIETVARRGYRFIADVSVVDEKLPDKQETATGQTRGPEDRDHVGIPGKIAVRKSRPLRGWAIPGFALLAVSAIFAVWKLRPGNPPPLAIRSLAVLPMESLSSDASQDYFADGMTDELITALGQISALRVISRTSVMMYKGARKPLPQIARELNVDAVVEGTVLRSSNKVRITAQLIQAATDQHLWAQSYEGELRDTLALQNKVARDIADQIRINLNPQERAALKNAAAVNPEAYEDYLQGRYFWNKRTADGLKRAIEYFNQAITKDPNYARAYSGLADSYALLGDWEYGVLTPKEAFPKAKAAAAKALVLDDNLGEAHTSLAFSLDLFDWDWESAEREYRRALALNPNNGTVHQWYAWHLITLGRNSEGIAELRKAESLDPLSLIIRADLADALVIARLPDESMQVSRKTIDMDPYFAVAHYALGQALVQKQMYGQAVAELQRAIELSGGDMTFTSTLACAYAYSGRSNEALKVLKVVQNQSDHGLSNASGIAMVYAGLGEKDQAMIWLEKAYAERFNPSILTRPAFDPLRSDTRFQDLLRRIGLHR